MPEARRQVPSPAVAPVTRRDVVTNDSSGSYGKNSLSGIGSSPDCGTDAPALGDLPSVVRLDGSAKGMAVIFHRQDLSEQRLLELVALVHVRAGAVA